MSPQRGPKRTLIRSLSPIAGSVAAILRCLLGRRMVGRIFTAMVAVGLGR
jgi:hypothetical protein